MEESIKGIVLLLCMLGCLAIGYYSGASGRQETIRQHLVKTGHAHYDSITREFVLKTNCFNLKNYETQ